MMIAYLKDTIGLSSVLFTETIAIDFIDMKHF